MKKKIWIIPLVSIICFISLIYFGMAAYYGGFSNDISSHRFIFGTWVNGKYATGRTVSEMNEILTVGDDTGIFTIVDHNGEENYLPLSKLGYETDYTDTLNTMISGQNPFLWVKGIPMGMNYLTNPEYSYNLDLFKDSIRDTDIFSNSTNDVTTAVVEIRYDADRGFWLYEELDDTLNSIDTIGDIENAISAGETSYTVSEDNLIHRKVTKENYDTYDLWDKISEVQSTDISYDMGDKIIHVDASVISTWIVDDNGKILFDEDGNIAFRDKCLEEFVEKLAEEYDTYGKPRQFHATSGQTVTINTSYIGTHLNQKEEVKYLSEAVAERRVEEHIPSYLKTTGVRGVDDIGDTYIEVDKTNQMMYYYVKGQLFVSTPVVTGNVSTSHATPSMVCPIVSKERDRYLIGPGYCSFVHYWMHIHNGIGIHDAMWRDEFGGEIYKNSGSHGCINTPDDAMISIFENAEIGTVVFIF